MGTEEKWSSERLDLKMLPGEKWWGLCNAFGREMPFTEATAFECDLRIENYGHQSLSLLCSERGRVIWCAEPVHAKIADGEIALGTNPDNVNGYPAKGGFLVSSLEPGWGGVPPPAAVEWWNGKSALLDFTHPNAVAEFAAIPLRGIDAAAPRPGENCCVVGQGAIGLLSARLFAAAGCRVTVADANERRLDIARTEGWGAVCVRDADAEARLARLGNGGFDIVVEASGSTPGFLLALKLLRRKPQNYTDAFKVEPIGFYRGDWPRLVVQANYLEKVPVDPWDFMNGEGVTVLTPFDRGVEERQKTIDEIRTGALRVDDLVAVMRRPEEMPDGYEALKRRDISTLVCDWR